MAFHYAKEKRKFDDEWKKTRRILIEEGVKEEDIKLLYDFYLHQFNRDRAFYNNTISLFEEPTKCENQDLTYLLQQASVTAEQKMIQEINGRYGWVELIEDPDLYQHLKELSNDDLELLTLHYIDGVSQRKIAKQRRCCFNSVNKKISRIKKYLKNF